MGAFDSKTVVVTGAARGIGRAIAEAFADEGADVAVCDVQAEWCDDTVAALRAKGVNATAFGVDVGSSEEVNRAVGAIVETFGRIDVLVNNAGITRDTLLPRMTDEQWDAVMQVNLRGTFLFTRAVARPMMKQKGGAIVSVASIIGLIGNAGQCNYAASKAGVIAFTKSVAKELASRNVRCNVVAPGFVATKMTEVLPEETKEQMLSAIPLRRFGEPADIAKAVLFLAGEQASYITGQTLTVSGGMVM